MLLAALRDSLHVYDPTTGKLMRKVPWDRPIYSFMAYSQDGRSLALSDLNESDDNNNAIHLFAFTCLLFNLVGVNLLMHGLHSYAGVG